MPLLVDDRLLLSRLRVATSNPCFFARPFLGRDPIQLSFVAFTGIHHPVDRCPQGREADTKANKQHSLLDSVFGVYGLVAGEEPYWDLKGER